MSRLWSSLIGMLKRIKDFSISIFRSLYNLIFKLMGGLLYILKLKKNSPFSESEEEVEIENSEEEIHDAEIRKLERKKKLFDQIMKVLIVVSVIGIIYANFIRKRPQAGIKAAELVNKLETVVKVTKK